jgi:hypothetical protein
MPKRKKEPVERVTIKLPRSMAQYFRKAFPHGKRSDFVQDCITEYRHSQEVKDMEEALRAVTKKRQ